MSEVASIGRPRKFEEQAVLAAVMDVFWEKGFEGTAMSDLVEATGLRKGSLYGAFGDKRELYLKALAFYDQTEVALAVDLLRGRIAQDGLNAPDAGYLRISALLQAVIDAVVVHGDRRGCLLCNAAVDQAPLDRATERSVNASLSSMENAFVEAVRAIPDFVVSVKEGRRTARHLLSVYFGMRVLAKAGVPVEVLNDAKSGALAGLKPL